jgi:methyl-accepting chemotaxis protein
VTERTSPDSRASAPAAAASSLAHDTSRGPKWLDRLYWLRTIRWRLYLAFGFAAGMTVVGSLFALYASADIGKTIHKIISQSMPATVASLRLSQDVSALVASAPRLMAADTENQRAAIAAEIAAESDRLTTRIESLQALDDSQSDEIEVAHAAMTEQLEILNKTVADRIKVSDQRRKLALSVRKSHENLLEAITPAIDDANFDLMTKDQSLENGALNQAIDALRRLLEIQAEANLFAGLLIESSMVADAESLPPLRDQIAAAKRDIETNLNALPQSDQEAKIADLYGKLAVLANGDGIIAQRVNELSREQDATRVYSAALAQAASLTGTVDSSIDQQGVAARTLSSRATSQIRMGWILLLVLSAAALAAAGLIAWLYVGRSIVGRLTLLSGAMQRIAAGDLNVQVAIRGRDEIAGMAQALLVFRQAIADVTVAGERETGRARDSEERRQQLETAMHNFERAVNDVAQSLDGASKSMDGCAHIMAEAAGHNRAQATATATASEEATSNVNNVAMAAEEIAQSVEHISAQARTSADMARQATGEAKAIIDTVGRLVSSVEQISNVSNLIRDVAAQTNLLALNATIEAARAGIAGRGFAVVAQEVKSLAAQTEKATGDITKQVSTIEQTTSSVVQAMRSIAETIAQLDENANNISVAVQQQDAVSKEIARSANAAAERTREVSASVAQVSNAAAKTGQVAAEVLSAGTELTAGSDRLRAEVERFLAQVRVA